MKTTATLFFILTLSMCSLAQTYTNQSLSNPTVTSFQLGATDYLELSNATGQNQTWDLTADGIISQLVYTLADLNTSPGSENFPSANYGIDINTDGQSLTLYFDLSANLLTELGFYSDFGIDALAQTYTDPKNYFSLPMNFGDSGSDTFAGENVLPGGVVQNVTGEISYEVVGTGTVITNAGTFENALLVLSIETVESVIDIVGTPFTTVTESETFDFFIEGFPAPIASMSSIETTTFNGVESTTEGFVLDSFESNLSSFELTSTELYPNPAQDMVNISLSGLSGSAQITFLDLTGKTILSEEVQGGISRIDLDGLGAGIYVVLVEMDGIVLRERLVVE